MTNHVVIKLQRPFLVPGGVSLLLDYTADVVICRSISTAGDDPPAPYGNFEASKPVDYSFLPRKH